MLLSGLCTISILICQLVTSVFCCLTDLWKLLRGIMMIRKHFAKQDFRKFPWGQWDFKGHLPTQWWLLSGSVVETNFIMLSVVRDHPRVEIFRRKKLITGQREDLPWLVRKFEWSFKAIRLFRIWTSQKIWFWAICASRRNKEEVIAEVVENFGPCGLLD